MFVKEYKFRFSDLDSNGNIKLSTILDLLQDVSISHSVSVGYGPEKMKEISLAMLLHGWRVKINEPLEYELPVTVKTGIMEVKRCNVFRRYDIIQNGKVKGFATGDWFSFDTEKRRIIRVPDELNDGYETIEEDDNEFPIVNLKPSDDAVPVAEKHVEKHDLDTNNHMNNMKSAEVALDYCSDGELPCELQIVYNRELYGGEKIFVYKAESENGCCVELHNESGEACVILNYMIYTF